MTHNFNQNAITKLKQLITEGINTYEEIETLNSGLSDTIKAVADELEIKPTLLKKAIKISYKNKLQDTNEEHEELNSILELAGRA